MDMCSSGHDEIVYDGPECPVCTIQDEVGQANDRLRKVQGEIEEVGKAAKIVFGDDSQFAERLAKIEEMVKEVHDDIEEAL